ESLPGKLALELLAAHLLRRLLAAHESPRTMARGREGELPTFRGPHEHERGAAHRPGDDHRLPDLAVPGRELGVPGPERPRRTLAVDAELPRTTFNGIGLQLGDVVGDVVDEVEPERVSPH